MVLIEISQKIVVIRKAIGFVHRLAGITEGGNNFAGLFGENLGGIFRMDTFEAVFLDAHGYEENKSQDYCGEAPERDTRRKACVFSSGSDHLRSLFFIVRGPP